MTKKLGWHQQIGWRRAVRGQTEWAGQTGACSQRPAKPRMVRKPHHSHISHYFDPITLKWGEFFNLIQVAAQNSQDDNHLPCHLFFLGGPVGFPSRIFAVFWCRTIRSRKPTCEWSWKKFRQKMQHWHRRFKLVERALLRPNGVFHQQLMSGRWGESPEDTYVLWALTDAAVWHQIWQYWN